MNNGGVFMDETIIIYTKFYSEAVVEIIDKYDLNIQLVCLSSYEDVISYILNTPNVRGLIFIEHKPSMKAVNAYEPILRFADEVAGATKQPFCVSFLSNNDNPRKIVQNLNTKNLDIYFTKFTFFNTDLLRFEGLATVIRSTIGVVNQSVLLELDGDSYISTNVPNQGQVEFFTLCLDITTVPRHKVEEYGVHTERYPQLAKLIKLRLTNDQDTLIMDGLKEDLFKIFCEQCINRRDIDEKTYGYSN